MSEGKTVQEKTERAGKNILDIKDKELLNRLQASFPLVERPFHQLAQGMGIGEKEVMQRVRHLKEQGIIREIGAIFDAQRLCYQSTLVAVCLPPSQLDKAAEIINRHPGVSHNYARRNEYNLWFTLTIPRSDDLNETVERLTSPTGAQSILLLPALRVFKIEVHFDLRASSRRVFSPVQRGGVEEQTSGKESLSVLEKRAVYWLQQDLLVVRQPFQEMTDSLQLSVEEFLALVRGFQRRGIMRRYGALLRHRKAGFLANAMGCWDVPVASVEGVGNMMASFPEVSHCYQRVTYPEWRYNLYTMIHGHHQEECEVVAREISQETGVKDYILLYSTKEYKKETVKFFPEYC